MNGRGSNSSNAAATATQELAEPASQPGEARMIPSSLIIRTSSTRSVLAHCPAPPITCPRSAGSTRMRGRVEAGGPSCARFPSRGAQLGPEEIALNKKRVFPRPQRPRRGTLLPAKHVPRRKKLNHRGRPPSAVAVHSFMR